MGSKEDLASVFLSHLPTGSDAATTAALDVELAVRLGAARAEWPNIALDSAAFMQHLAHRSSGGLPLRERAGDLFLACACAHGVPAALDAFFRRHRVTVERAIARMDPSSAFADEVMQALGAKLLVRSGSANPGIAKYSGRSSLATWLATSAARTALNMRRRKDDGPRVELESVAAALHTSITPELLLLKATYKDEFEKAIRAALAAIPREQRALLLLQVSDGLTLPQLATVHRVSRATVARWLAAAREVLVETTRQLLAERLRLSPADYDSVAALVRSQLDLTLSTLRSETEGVR